MMSRDAETDERNESKKAQEMIVRGREGVLPASIDGVEVVVVEKRLQKLPWHVGHWRCSLVFCLHVILYILCKNWNALVS